MAENFECECVSNICNNRKSVEWHEDGRVRRTHCTAILVICPLYLQPLLGADTLLKVNRRRLFPKCSLYKLLYSYHLLCFLLHDFLLHEEGRRVSDVSRNCM